MLETSFALARLPSSRFSLSCFSFSSHPCPFLQSLVSRKKKERREKEGEERKKERKKERRKDACIRTTGHISNARRHFDKRRTRSAEWAIKQHWNTALETRTRVDRYCFALRIALRWRTDGHRSITCSLVQFLLRFLSALLARRNLPRNVHDGTPVFIQTFISLQLRKPISCPRSFRSLGKSNGEKSRAVDKRLNSANFATEENVSCLVKIENARSVSFSVSRPCKLTDD